MIGFSRAPMKGKKRKVGAHHNIARFGRSWSQQSMASYSHYNHYQSSVPSVLINPYTNNPDWHSPISTLPKTDPKLETHSAASVTSQRTKNSDRNQFAERFSPFLPPERPSSLRGVVAAQCCVTCITVSLDHSEVLYHLYHCSCAATVGVHWFPSKSSGVAGSQLPTYYPDVTAV